ncbi:MAG: signal peptidase II [Longimicrobiales bacterium]
MNRKVAMSGLLLAAILVLDFTTKQWALDRLWHGHSTSLGFVPLTLTFNTGVAFGLGVGEFRWLIVAGTILVMGALTVLLRQAEPGDRLRVFSIAAVMAGAAGNLIDRLKWDKGVVDFIGPINLGFTNFPIFNVADMAITCGALVLAVSLWREERAIEARKAAVETNTDPV